MPRIPSASDIRRGTPQSASTIQTPAYTTEGSGLVSAAGALGEISRDIEKRVAQRDKNRDRLELSKARSEWVKVKAEQDSAYNNDSDFKTMEERYRGAVSQKGSEISAAITNPETREIFENSIGADIEIGASRIKGKAFAQETDFEKARLSEDLAKFRDIALSGNTLGAIEAAGERIDSLLDSGFISQQEAVDYRQKMSTDYAVSRVKLADPGDRAALLKTGLGNFIDKDVQKQLLKSASAQYTRGLDDYLAYLSAGNAPTEEMSRKYSPQKVRANTGGKAGKIIEAIQDAEQFGAAANSIKTATPEQLKNILQSSTPKSPDKFRRESKQQQVLISAINQRNKSIASDPALYVNNNYVDVKDSYDALTEALNGDDPAILSKVAIEYADAQREAQEELGLPYNSVQLLPKQLEDKIALQLNDFSEGGENPALLLDTLKTSLGSEWPAVQRQLQSNKKIGSAIRVMSGMDFGPELIAVAEANSVGQKAYKETIDADTYKDITEKSQESLEDFQNTLRGQPGGDAAYIQHKTSIEALAMKYVADGMFDDADDALEQAYEDVIGKRFEFYDTYRVPKVYETDRVEQGVDNALEDIQSDKYELLIPKSSVLQNEEDRKEVYYSKLRPRAITSPDGDGISFIDQSGSAILKKDGQPLMIPFTELEKTRDEGIFGFFGDEDVDETVGAETEPGAEEGAAVINGLDDQLGRGDIAP